MLNISQFTDRPLSNFLTASFQEKIWWFAIKYHMLVYYFLLVPSLNKLSYYNGSAVACEIDSAGSEQESL